jgi:hypothetical protein
VGSYLSDADFAGVSLGDFAATSLPSSVVDGFVAFAAEAGVIVPNDDRALLEDMLMLQVAWGQWGPPGFYTVVALHDPAVAEAVTHLESARRLLADSTS